MTTILLTTFPLPGQVPVVPSIECPSRAGAFLAARCFYAYVFVSEFDLFQTVHCIMLIWMHLMMTVFFSAARRLVAVVGFAYAMGGDTSHLLRVYRRVGWHKAGAPKGHSTQRAARVAQSKASWCYESWSIGVQSWSSSVPHRSLVCTNLQT